LGGSAKVSIRLLLHPADRVLTGLLLLAVVIAGWRAPGRPEVAGSLVLHLALLLGFLATVAAMVWWERRGWVQLVRPAIIVAIIFTLYSSLGRLGLAAMPYTLDAGLSRADTGLCGVDPSLFLQRYLTYGRVQFFSFVYGAFIPYVALLYGERAGAAWRRLRTFLYWYRHPSRQQELARAGRAIIADIRALGEQVPPGAVIASAERSKP
jgi:hypothetical protein